MNTVLIEPANDPVSRITCLLPAEPDHSATPVPVVKIQVWM